MGERAILIRDANGHAPRPTLRVRLAPRWQTFCARLASLQGGTVKIELNKETAWAVIFSIALVCLTTIISLAAGISHAKYEKFTAGNYCGTIDGGEWIKCDQLANRAAASWNYRAAQQAIEVAEQYRAKSTYNELETARIRAAAVGVKPAEAEAKK